MEYDDADYKTNPKAKLETSVSPTYIDKLLPEEWDANRYLLKDPTRDGVSDKVFRNELILTFATVAADWDALTDASKKILAEKYHVWKEGLEDTALNLFSDSAARDAGKIKCREDLNSDNRNLFSIWEDTDGKCYKVYLVSGVTTKKEVTTYEVM